MCSSLLVILYSLYVYTGIHCTYIASPVDMVFVELYSSSIGINQMTSIIRTDMNARIGANSY